MAEARAAEGTKQQEQSTVVDYLAAVDNAYQARMALEGIPRGDDEGSEATTYLVQPKKGSDLVLEAVMSRTVANWGRVTVKAQKITSTSQPFTADGYHLRKVEGLSSAQNMVFATRSEVLTHSEDETEFWKDWRRRVGSRLGAKGGFLSARNLEMEYESPPRIGWSVIVPEEVLREVSVIQLLNGEEVVAQWPPASETLPILKKT